MTARRARLIGAAATLAGAVVARTAHAQTWRTIDESRQLRDTAPVNVRVDYAAGKLELRPGTGALLYHANVRYDANRTEPLAHFDSASRTLALGVHLRNLHLESDEHENDAGSMHAELTTRAPLDLTVELGAVEADLQFGGLRVAALTMHCGAADVTSHFDQPNAAALSHISLQVGAAQVKMMDLANSGVSHINADVGAGSLTLDFTGTLLHDVDVTASVAFGAVTVNATPEEGVFVEESALLGGFDKTGFVKRADGWYSDNYDAAARHVRVRLNGFLGGLKIVRSAG